MLTPSSAPIQKLDLSPFGLSPDQLCIKREDLSHALYGGNKLRKLQFNLLKAQQMGQDTVLTFGGPWSNHIYSTAAACKDCGLRSIGVIRGERPARLSTTLAFAETAGMKLVFVSRAEYREKDEAFFKAWLRDQFGSCYLIPEGGSNFLGMQGCAEMLDKETAGYKHIIVAMGTGATAAGLTLASKTGQQVHGVPVLNQGAGLADAVEHHLYNALMDREAVADTLRRFTIHPNFQQGGFARWNPALVAFMRSFHEHTGIKLDHVYTAKAMMAAISLIREEKIPSPVLFIHTGGLQGLAGLERELGEAVYS